MNDEYNHIEHSREVRIAILCASAFTLLIHLYVNLFTAYGIFRDEFYYLACTNHLSAGYVDQPPLSIYLLALMKWIAGESLFAIRLLPAVTASVTVYITGLLTARMGGKTVAVLTACITLALSPIFLGMNSIFSMNTFDHLFWVLAAYLVIRIIQKNKPVFWILLGITLGLGMLNKISMGWFAAGLAAGLFFTPLRLTLKSKWPYLAALIALLIFSPFVIWNVTHDFAHLEFIRNATLYKYNALTPEDFIGGQLILPGPASVLVWLPGLIYLLISKEMKKYRIPAIIFLTTSIILILNWHSKAEYLAPAYPIVLAGGGIFIEKVSARRLSGWIKYAVLSLIVLTGILFMPLSIPILPVETFISYSAALGMTQPNSEHKELPELPQFYADMFGWEDLAKATASVFNTIPDSEKSGTIIYAGNYGEAGALEYYSSRYTLPAVVCPHNSYWYWCEPGRYKIKTVIVIGGDIQDHRSIFRDVNLAAVHNTKYSMPYENNLPIYICMGISRPLKEVWRQAKEFI